MYLSWLWLLKSDLLFLVSQVLELGALSKLMKMVKSSFIEEAVKALYTVSSLIRNNLAGQEMFYVEAGDLMLQVTTE